MVNKKLFFETLEETRVVVVCRKLPNDQLVDIINALYEGGIRICEVPFDQLDVESNKNTAAQIKTLVEKFKDKMFIGSGTTCTVEQFKLAKDAGAMMIIAPNMDPEIIDMTVENGLISIPGCQTPSEMVTAHKHGADLIKLFPSTNMSLAYIKEITMPLNNIKTLKFGGVTADNIKDFIDIGCSGVGLQSAVLDKQAIKDKDYAKITRLAKEVIDKVK